MYKEIKIQDEYIKLDQLLKLTGFVETGGQAKIMILNGDVKVNDHIIMQRGKKIRPGDVVTAGDFVIKVMN